MIHNESLVVHVELFDGFATRTAQDLSRHDVETCHVVVRKLELGVHDTAQVVRRSVYLEDYDFSVHKGGLDVDLSDLGDLRDQVLNLDIVVDLDLDVHWLVIVHVVVTLSELLEVLLITVRLATVHPLEVALV